MCATGAASNRASASNTSPKAAACPTPIMISAAATPPCSPLRGSAKISKRCCAPKTAIISTAKSAAPWALCFHPPKWRGQPAAPAIISPRKTKKSAPLSCAANWAMCMPKKIKMCPLPCNFAPAAPHRCAATSSTVSALRGPIIRCCPSVRWPWPAWNTNIRLPKASLPPCSTIWAMRPTISKK